MLLVLILADANVVMAFTVLSIPSARKHESFDAAARLSRDSDKRPLEREFQSLEPRYLQNV